MNKIINVNNLRSFCYLNDDKVKENPKGLIIEFRGLGAQMMFNEYPKADVYSDHNILYMIPYLNPWNWMNEQALNEIEELINVILEKYNMNTIKIASTGNSMGGLCALTYASYAKRIPDIVVANCPVCDLEYHYTERPDLPRTLYCAYYNANSNKDFFDTLSDYSPLRLAQRNLFPKTNYVIFHCDHDSQVNIDKHTRKWLEEMKDYKIDFKVVKDRDHCDLDEEAQKIYQEVLLNTFDK